MELRGKTICFLGDSITEGYGLSDFEGDRRKRYTSVMEGMFGIKALNYGVSGSRFARQRILTDSAMDRDFCMRLEEMPEKADAVVVFGGVNDFGHGSAFIGKPEDRTPETFYGACHYLMEHLIEKYPEALIAVVTPLHYVNEDSTTGNGMKTWEGRTLKEYVAIIRGGGGVLFAAGDRSVCVLRAAAAGSCHAGVLFSRRSASQ